MQRKFKIAMLGTAGTGRTTVALEISKKLNIPFLASSSITKPILERDGFSYSSGLFVEKFLSVKNRELEIIGKKIELESHCDEFITDRTTLDNFAYLFLNIEQYSDVEVEQVRKLCFDNMCKYSHLFYFSRTNKPIKNNGVRTVNKWFQMQVDFIIQGLVKEWDITAYEVVNMDEKQSVEFILKTLEVKSE